MKQIKKHKKLNSTVHSLKATKTKGKPKCLSFKGFNEWQITLSIKIII